MTRDSRRWTSGWVGAAAGVASVLVAATALWIDWSGGDTTIVVDRAPAGADEIDEATLLFMYGTMKPG